MLPVVSWARAAARRPTSVVFGMTSPVIWQEVVEHVVNRHHPDESMLLVDDRHRDEVVAREDAADLGGATCRPLTGSRPWSMRVPRRSCGGYRSMRWKCTMPRNRPVGGSYGGRVTHTAAPSAGGRSWRRMSASALGDGRVGRDDDRLGRHQAAGRVGAVGEQEAHVVGLFGLHELEQVLAALLGQLGDEVGRVVGLHLVEHVGGAVVAEPGEDVDLVGSRASPRARRRGDRRAAPRRPPGRRSGGRSRRVFARSAGFSSEYVAMSCSADCASPVEVASRTSRQVT